MKGIRNHGRYILSCHPAPNPVINRPSEIWSIIAIILAKIAGGLKDAEITAGASLIVFVA